jgi:Tol biopolymer transport system component
VWAPDAQAIAFISDQGGVRNVWVMDPSGSIYYQITHFTDPVHSLAYSPIPGEERVVVSLGPGNSRSLYIVSLISGDIERRLTE